MPPSNGESISDLHERMAFVLSRIIADADATLLSDKPQAILLSGHAAPMIATGRVLTGQMPDDPTEKDFDTYTCSISKFNRRFEARENPTASTKREKDELYFKLEWKGGHGVAEGWTCELNANVDHLPNGGERNW